MSGKLASLKTALGGNIAESMGKGSTVPVQAPALGVPASQVGVQRLKSGAFSIQLDRIIPDPGQPRKDFDDAELKRLAASLLMHGQLQPIRVRWDEGQGRYLVIAGERRWRAASALKWDSIQCVVADPATGERDAARASYRRALELALPHLGPEKTLRVTASLGVAQRLHWAGTPIPLIEIGRAHV